MSAWADDALWLGPLICARLREQMPELREALVLDSFEPGKDDPLQDPAAVVLLHDLRPPEVSVTTSTVVEMDWLVLLCVRSARKDGDRMRQVMGPLVSQAVRAMQGWQPSGSQRTFAWRRGPRPDYAKTITYFPLLFTIQAVAK